MCLSILVIKYIHLYICIYVCAYKCCIIPVSVWAQDLDHQILWFATLIKSNSLFWSWTADWACRLRSAAAWHRSMPQRWSTPTAWCLEILIVWSVCLECYPTEHTIRLWSRTVLYFESIDVMDHCEIIVELLEVVLDYAMIC